MKKETRFWQWLKPRFPLGHVIRIENPACPGTPDVNCCIQGEETWIELKQTEELPKRSDTKVFGKSGLRPDQVLWIRIRVRHGARVFIAARTPVQDFWIPGKFCEQFNDMSLEELKEAHDPTWAREHNLIVE